MSWQILIIISVFLYSVSVLLQRVISTSKNSDAKATAIVYQLFTGILVGLAGWMTGSLAMPSLSEVGITFILAAFLYAAANFLVFKSLAKVEASLFSIILSSNAIITVIFAYIFLSERLSTENFGGVFLVVAGVLLVNLKSTKVKFSQGEIWAGLAALSFGLAHVLDRILLADLELYGYVSLMFILPALLTLALSLRERSIISKIKIYLQPPLFEKTVLLSVIYGASAIAFFKALVIAQSASRVVTANISSVVVTVILAAIILKERDNLPRKILASIITFAGLYLVSL